MVGAYSVLIRDADSFWRTSKERDSDIIKTTFLCAVFKEEKEWNSQITK